MPLTNEQRDKLYLERLLEHQKETREHRFYSIQRIDLLVISISGAGIYIIFETLKFVKSDANHNYDDLNLNPLIMGGLFFALAVLMNFGSQWTGHAANDNESNSTELEIEKEKNGSTDEIKKRKLDSSVKFYNAYTAWLNILATILMAAGIAMLVWFYLFIF